MLSLAGRECRIDWLQMVLALSHDRSGYQPMRARTIHNKVSCIIGRAGVRALLHCWCRPISYYHAENSIVYSDRPSQMVQYLLYHDTRPFSDVAIMLIPTTLTIAPFNQRYSSRVTGSAELFEPFLISQTKQWLPPCSSSFRWCPHAGAS
jgi:hypothetical protein